MTPVTYTVQQIPIERIRAFAFQPRKWFNPEEIHARAESMRALGQQDPVTVERVEDDPDYDYELINGESRLRSAREAGITTLWAAVRSVPFPSMAEKHMASLVANFNRSDHTPMEISNALYVQVTQGKKTQLDLARAIGKTDYWVSAYLSLQKLHPDIQACLHPTAKKTDRIPTNAGFALARVPIDRQLEILRLAKGSDGRITLLRVQIEIERLMGAKKTRKLTPSKRRERIVNAMRSLRLDLAKLKRIVGADPAEVAKALRDEGKGGSGLLEEGIDSLQSVRSTLSRVGGPPMPKAADPERMTPADREAYEETWKRYWLSFPPPNEGDYLLMEVAYPRRPLNLVGKPYRSKS